MKSFLAALCAFLVSCSTCVVNEEDVIVLMKNHADSRLKTANQSDMEFWRRRIDPANPQFQNELKYAGTLVSQFRFCGDIQDIIHAEEIYQQVNQTYNQKIPGPFLGLVTTGMLTHRFALADTLLRKAKSLGIHSYTDRILSFDLAFEQGRYQEAEFILKKIHPYNDFNYFFRQSKMDHFNGDIEQAIEAMSKAADLEKSNALFESLALSSLGDLYLHRGEFREAADYFNKSLALNGDDFHSMMGLGWIALTKDNNAPLAIKLFSFVRPRYKLPDPLYKLYQAAQLSDDHQHVQQAATEYVAVATDSRYGRMYNKYLVEIYCDILAQPSLAEKLALDELSNRRTPQTLAWYVYALFKNDKTDQALELFQQEISGQPLEGLELYYMGQLLLAAGKRYDARQYFAAAYENRFDLSPSIQKALAELKE